jgi:hypothetical protein
MERLTERYPGTVAYIGRHSRKVPGFPVLADTMRVAATREVLQRLAESEDTGLSPEQIKRAAPQRPSEPCPHCRPNLHDKTRHLHAIETEAGWQLLHTKNVLYCCACGREL